MTTAVLGKPWVHPKAVNSAGGKEGEACPGKPSIDKLAPPDAAYTVGFTRGTQRGASIARFTVATVTDSGAAQRAAWTKTATACVRFTDASHLFVVTSLEGPTSVSGADDVASRAERIYYDARHKKLAYARHFISARTGRAITTVEYDFLTTKSDPQAKDFTTTTKLLALQLPRTRAAFSR